MSSEEKIAAVSVCVSIYADVETTLNGQKDTIAQLIDAITEAHTVGVGRGGEYLRIVNMLEDARGRVASALERVVAAHEKCTVIAKREECDVALPAAGFAIQPLSGGPR